MRIVPVYGRCKPASAQNRTLSDELRMQKSCTFVHMNRSDSIKSVFNILPDLFRNLIESGQFDTGLIQSVPGGDYEVPLYYVTKAYDFLLRGSLGIHAWQYGPEEDNIDDYYKELKEFLKEENADRSRRQACQHNREIIAIWKEQFNIDIDALEIDFKQFNKHLPPNVSEDHFEYYFRDAANGVVEYALGPVNHTQYELYKHPDSVSQLMEFAAYICYGYANYQD